MGFSEDIYHATVTSKLNSIEKQLELQNKIIILTEQVKCGIISPMDYEEKIKALGIKF